MTAAAPKSGLHAKLAYIRGAYGAVEKTGKPKEGPQFSFVEASHISGKLVEMFSAENLTMLPVGQEYIGSRPTKSEKQMIDTILTTWRITDADTGEFIDVQSFGQGADQTDKSLPKAQTNSMKYAILLLLQKAGDDPEKDAGSEGPAVDSAAQTAMSPEFVAWMAASQAAAETIAAENAGQAQVDDVFAEDLRDPLPGRGGPLEPLEPEAKPKRTRAKAKTTPAAPQPVVEQTAVGDFLPPSAEKKSLIHARGREAGLDDAALKALTVAVTRKASSAEWTDADADQIIGILGNEAAVAIFASMKATA